MSANPRDLPRGQAAQQASTTAEAARPFMRPIAETAAYLLLRMCQHTSFRGSGSYSGLAPTQTQIGFPEAEVELARVDEFFQFFPDRAAAESVCGKTVLDFGCGYGGRTVGYASLYGAREVIGVEVFENMVQKCREFAAARKVENCRFLLSSQSEIPLPENSVDLIVSYDVMEHVDDPVLTLRELHRVLKPTGRLLLVFTPYWGALSHHFGFITRLPGVHWLFSSKTLTNATNRYLATPRGSSLRKSPLPPPRPAFGAKRWCTASINGMTTKEFLAIPHAFKVISVRAVPLLARYRVLGPIGEKLNAIVSQSRGAVGEAVSFNLVCVMEK